MKDHAKFTAEIAKGINIKESNVELKLLIPLKSAQEHLIFLSSNQGEKVNVFLGDPQVSFDFGDEDPMYQKLTGRFVTTDSSGIVTRVEKPDGHEEDENQQTLFDQNPEQEGDSAAGEPEGDDDSNPNQSGSGLDEEVPDWMKGVDGEGEMDFTEDGGSQEPSDSEGELTDYEQEIMGESSGDQPEGTQDVAGDVEISKEALEEFILANRPTCPDLETDLDFPALLEKRRSGDTWMGISKEIGIPSSQLNAKFRKYKDHVKKIMKDGGAA
ncbi:hypothetical protein [Fontibacillus sp. BL9]|uniref:hypothetical protein n=1 Tax=Fontibacillus sp. BL9 TaxID=3389971 RepID=UPI0039786A02